MFDSVLGRGVTPKSRFGSGAVVSVLLHVGLLGFALWFSTRPPPKEDKDVAVVLKVAPPPPPPPPPPASSTVKHEVKKTPKTKDKIVQPKEVPQEKPKEADPKENDEPEGVEGGVKGGVVGGVVGGVLGGVVGGQLGSTTLAFGEGMTRPEPLPGQPAAPEYTREAREARMEGLMIVKCVITVEGRVQNCQIIKPLAHMENSVLSWLTSRRYKPVMFQGKPQQVSYVFNVKVTLPR